MRELAMSLWPAQPGVYEINTAVWLNDLGRKYGGTVTLAGVPDSELARLAGLRFDGLWLMGVWRRSPASRSIALTDEALRNAYLAALPDYRAEDVIGSPFAVHEYTVDSMFGGDEELRALRLRMRGFGLRLILDFVPNHVARDHAWVMQHPEYLVQGTVADLRSHPEAWFASREQIFAHGRDPYFPAWTDTVQIDYRRPETRRAVTDLLLSLAGRCDGMRCDMAMLVTRNVFCRTWGGQFEGPGADFWPEAIPALKSAHPDFLIGAEVYWDLEYELQQQGFDYTYDKRLYDRLTGNDPEQVRGHLRAGIDYQRRLVRFIENHDEPRAAAVFGVERSKAVATLALTLPGLHMVHDGQMEGFKTRLPVQLARRPHEEANPDLVSFYERLMKALSLDVFHKGDWRSLECTDRNFVAHRWVDGADVVLVAANLSAQRAQCYVPLEFPALAGRSWELRDLVSDACYQREGDALLHPGLYLDVPAYGHHIFRFDHSPLC
jgi:glycosidase